MIDRKSNGQLQSFLLDDKPLVKNPPTSCELIYFLAFRQTTTTFFSTNFFSSIILETDECPNSVVLCRVIHGS